MNKIIIFSLGFLLVAAGMSMVLRNWTEVAIVFEGIASPAVAVAGLVLMFWATLKK